MIILFGNYGSTNIGDEAILHGMIKRLHKEGLNDFIVMSHGVVYTQESLKEFKYIGVNNVKVKVIKTLPAGVRSLSISLLNGTFFKALSYIWKADKIVFAGGGLLQDDERYAMIIWSLYFTICKIFRKKIEWRAVSVGPINDIRYIKTIKSIIQNSDKFTIRDEQSNNYFDKKLDYELDGVYELDIVKDYGIEKIDRDKIRIGVSLRNHKRVPLDLITELNTVFAIDREDIEFITLPFDTYKSDDRNILRSLLADKHIQSTWTPREMFQEVYNLDILVGMRLHSIIFAQRLGIKYIPLIYSPKIIDFVKGDFDVDKLKVDNFDKEYFSEYLNKYLNEI